MKQTASRLLHLINHHLPALQNINGEEYSRKPAPNKWSRKEILGHLIDSAQSNIRRFVKAQYEETPLITYN
ncbi:MAG: DinB family protein [Bacteroidetes bacterium]|nr:DinB family protein [Bacteroidota bacterium]